MKYIKYVKLSNLIMHIKQSRIKEKERNKIKFKIIK